MGIFFYRDGDRMTNLLSPLFSPVWTPGRRVNGVYSVVYYARI